MLCPLTKEKCKESNDPETGCRWWVYLIADEKETIGRCTFEWLPILLTELRQAVNSLVNNISNPQKVKVKRKVGNKK